MGDKLPAVPTPTDLDGWSSDDVVTHLDNLVLNFKRGRIEVGLLLWKLRTLEPDNVAYGDKVSPFAAKFDVTVATLGRWRQAAEEEFELIPAIARPKNEPAGQKGEFARTRANSKPVVDVDSKAATDSNNGSGIATTDVAKPTPSPRDSSTSSEGAKPMPEQLSIFDFETAQHTDLVALGKKRLMTVQKKISEALRYAE